MHPVANSQFSTACHLHSSQLTVLPLQPLATVQVGESPRLTAIAELLEEAVQREDGRGTVLEARKIIHLVDSKASLWEQPSHDFD